MPVPAVTLQARYRRKGGDFLLLPFRGAKEACFPLEMLPEDLRRLAKAPLKAGKAWTVFSGRLGRTRLLARAARLDAEHSDNLAEMKKAVAACLRKIDDEGAKRLVVFLDAAQSDLVLAAQEGALLGGYAFDRYLDRKASPKPVLLVVHGSSGNATLARALKRRACVHECVNFARDVLNEPPNAIAPPALAKEFQRRGRSWGLKVAVWDEKRPARERCGAILAVGQGAKAKPRLVIGEYAPPKAKKHLCLVGKGVTFDTGGYCLKPPAGQIGMKYDMAGAAMMFAGACAIARLGLPIRVTVLTPLAENAVSGEAYHTTSIITTRAGRTVEVDNTDAEGRLILTDALTLAAERNPDWIVDAATLTGACVIALGEDVAGAMGTDPDLTRALLEAGVQEGESFWELPLHMPYVENLKATVADCKNVGGKWGGALVGGLFLSKWVPQGLKWVHCDVAGPAGKEEPLGHLGKGAKGFGVKTICALGAALAQAR